MTIHIVFRSIDCILAMLFPTARRVVIWGSFNVVVPIPDNFIYCIYIYIYIYIVMKL